MYLQRFSGTRCCLCGSTDRLTSEHKIKASALRAEFGNEALFVGTSGDSTQKLRSAQSANSKHLKFPVQICEACNTARTQPADREFDRFHGLAIEVLGGKEDPGKVFDLPQYRVGSAPYLNVFRYFAKLMCCHIAAVNGPVPTTLAEFAIGRNSLNRIWLRLKSDPSFLHMVLIIGDHRYAAHGGLIVYGDKNTHEANGFHSTLTLGPLQYVFHMRLEGFEKEKIRETFPDFQEWCVREVESALRNPISDSDLIRAGLNDESARQSLARDVIAPASLRQRRA
ncbi:MAG: hypothetical protein RKP20_08555 [Candidatus Competibacter sp.]|nr:hypothetical protein [Candidatus Competibacter sp.]